MNRLTITEIIISSVMFLGAVSYVSSESNVQAKTYKIGERGPAGGWIIYDNGDYSEGWRYMEAAPEDIEDIQWGCYNRSIPGAKGTAVGTGKRNTQAIVNMCKEVDTAAKKCTEYRGGEKSDWFLPSKDELDAMYVNLHKAGIGGFADNTYWSSFEHDAANAGYQSFYTGSQDHGNKFFKTLVRPVRAF